MAGTEEGAAKSAEKQRGVKRPHYDNSRRKQLAALRKKLEIGERALRQAQRNERSERQEPEWLRHAPIGLIGKALSVKQARRNGTIDATTYDPNTGKRRCCIGCSRVVTKSRSWVVASQKLLNGESGEAYRKKLGAQRSVDGVVTFLLHGRRVRALCRRCVWRMLNGWLDSWLELEERPE